MNEGIPEGEGKNYEGIENAQNFDELFAALDTLGGLQGSSQFYSTQDLKDKIQAVRAGAGVLVLGGITKTGGLKNKVVELFTKESRGEKK